MTKQSRLLNLYRRIGSGTATSAAGVNNFNGVLVDIKNLLETIAGQGDEIVVTKATSYITLRNYFAAAVGEFVGEIAAIVSDQAIAAAAPAATTEETLVDSLDQMTAGDFESQKLAEVGSKLVEHAAADYTTYRSTLQVDFTSVAQKVARTLARSAVLSTNPYASLVIVGWSATANAPPSYRVYTRLEYYVRPKQLRMLA